METRDKTEQKDNISRNSHKSRKRPTRPQKQSINPYFKRIHDRDTSSTNTAESSETESTLELNIFKHIEVNNIGNKEKPMSTSVVIEINNIQVTALLDGGATTTTVNPEIAKKCNLKIKPINSNRQLGTAEQGRTLQPLGTAMANFKFGENEFSHEVLVVDNLAHKVYIGTDIIKGHGFRLLYDTDQLVTGNSSIPMKSRGPTSYQICAQHDLIIEPGEEEVIHAKIPPNNMKNFLIENFNHRINVREELKTRHGTLGRIEITVRNPSEKKLRIRRGTILAKASGVIIEGALSMPDQLPNGIEETNESIQAFGDLKGQKHERQAPWKPSTTMLVDHKNLTPEQIEALNKLADEYNDVFSKDDQDIGTSKYKHKITLTDKTPFHGRPYRVPYKQKQIVEEHVNQMLEMGIIRPSSSEYASPIVLVKKADGTIRFCVDYRKLNQITARDNYPMPLIEEKLDLLHGKTIFSTLDLTSG